MPRLPPPQNLLSPSPLFTIRVWQENLGDGEIAWRGKIQDVISGEVHYFRDWYALVETLQTMLKPYYKDPLQDQGSTRAD
jgi:hypothetical protein